MAGGGDSAVVPAAMAEPALIPGFRPAELVSTYLWYCAMCYMA